MAKTKRIFLEKQVREQRKWIEACEANGKSYTGPNGTAIRQADEQALREWELQLRKLK